VHLGSLSTRKGLVWPSEQLAALLNGRAEVVGFTAQEGALIHFSRPGRLNENRMFDWLETQLRSQS
jgi:hypothetical protein